MTRHPGSEQVLGQGAFGIVLRAELHGTPVAVKRALPQPAASPAGSGGATRAPSGPQGGWQAGPLGGGVVSTQRPAAWGVSAWLTTVRERAR